MKKPLYVFFILDTLRFSCFLKSFVTKNRQYKHYFKQNCMTGIAAIVCCVDLPLNHTFKIYKQCSILVCQQKVQTCRVQEKGSYVIYTLDRRRHRDERLSRFIGFRKVFTSFFPRFKCFRTFFLFSHNFRTGVASVLGVPGAQPMKYDTIRYDMHPSFKGRMVP